MPKRLWNGRVRIRSSITTVSTLAKNGKINIFGTLEFNERLVTGVFIQEKQLNFSKNSELCGILTFPPSSPQLCSSLENHRPGNHGICEKPAAWQPQEGEEWVWSSPKSLITKEWSLFDLNGNF